ncbi:hypothetical protein PFDG_03258 [Plasmodium falciparum Dd2]|uniref:Uncharacterized protein n=1 Tax=Plasmodium falciparum (isolate Dd2) TaxID=57267 RepID=A0A0L7M744_PLAF4|nr:hypothetical protein PFDG_03258 [Plasmodium falciparum Dd2]
MIEIDEKFIWAWVKNKISFSKYDVNNIWKDTYNDLLFKWVYDTGSKILFIYMKEDVNEDVKLQFSLDFPRDIINEEVDEYMRFLKVNRKNITYENMDNLILYNKIKYNIKENILNLMDRVFIPTLDMRYSSRYKYTK